MKKTRVKDIAAHIDLHDLADIAREMSAAGLSQLEIVDHVIDLIAAATPFSAIGPAGVAIDAAEPVVVKAIARFVTMLGRRKR